MATSFRLVSTQRVTNPFFANGPMDGSLPTEGSLTGMVLRFTLDPITGAISGEVIQ